MQSSTKKGLDVRIGFIFMENVKAIHEWPLRLMFCKKIIMKIIFCFLSRHFNHLKGDDACRHLNIHFITYLFTQQPFGYG